MEKKKKEKENLFFSPTRQNSTSDVALSRCSFFSSPSQ